MPDSMNPIPSPKERTKKRNLTIAAIAVFVVVVLIAVVILGGFLNKGGNEDENALDRIKGRGTLIVGTNVPWEPFETFNATSEKYEGFDVDVITFIAQSMGVGVEFRSMDFDALVGALEGGQIDVAVSSIAIRPDLEEKVDFSTPYYEADQAVLVHDDSTIANTDDLNGTVVAARHDTTGYYCIEDNLNATGIAYDTILDTVVAVENNQSDVQSAILDAPFADRYAADPAYHLKVVSIIPTNEQYGIACAKGENELVAAINDVISGMKADGSLEAMLDRWT